MIRDSLLYWREECEKKQNPIRPEPIPFVSYMTASKHMKCPKTTKWTSADGGRFYSEHAPFGDKYCIVSFFI